jgi:phosphatidylglycerol lysyltransferase
VARRSSGEPVAFANVLATVGKEELSVDLMRHSAAAARGVMDYLFVRLMLWGREHGYAWFNLGMAPLSGLDARALAPTWVRVEHWLYGHGEHFYNFQGLRQYKDKFDPVWTPKYLASPGGLARPRILANVAALIGGGLRGVVAR